MEKGLIVSLTLIIAVGMVVMVVVGGEASYPILKEPCPHGCRCMNTFNMHQGRHRWHHLLAAYRMRRLVYGQHGAGSRLQIGQRRTGKGDEDTGREMTCLGLPNLPEYVPSGEYWWL